MDSLGFAFRIGIFPCDSRQESSPVRSEVVPVITRWAKLLLLAGIAVDYTLVVFGNLTDFDSNYEFVRHVLLMDSTFPGNHGMWRAIHTPGLHLVFYWAIIAWEFMSMVLTWWGAADLFRAVRGPAAAFNAEKRVAVMALTLSLLMWLVAFLEVGGEWFMMWQSRTWNGQEEAFRMFAIIGLVLLLLLQPDTDAQA
jgi:predicted small integral membrane protein